MTHKWIPHIICSICNFKNWGGIWPARVQPRPHAYPYHIVHLIPTVLPICLVNFKSSTGMEWYSLLFSSVFLVTVIGKCNQNRLRWNTLLKQSCYCEVVISIDGIELWIVKVVHGIANNFVLMAIMLQRGCSSCKLMSGQHSRRKFSNEMRP